jgi:hypothetical protein
MTSQQAIERLVAIVRVIVPLAAAGQIGQCYCRRAIPWFRTGWAKPTCAEHIGMQIDVVDLHRRTTLETEAMEISGLKLPEGWSS